MNVIDALMATSSRFSSLKDELLKAVEEGLMVEVSLDFRFVHDKVRLSYDL